MKKKGFTLIEFLILVSVINILATIAVPNFLEAQTRSNVSRIRGEFRKVAAAIEAYTTDNNRTPRQVHTSWYPIDQITYAEWYARDGSVIAILWNGLTTPVAYISRVDFVDPFMIEETNKPYDLRHYTYIDSKTYAETYPSSTFWTTAYEYYGAWKLGSVGPDKIYSHYFVNSAQLLYDPTNGTISLGNVWRTQKLPYGTPQPPAGGPLLGVH